MSRLCMRPGCDRDAAARLTYDPVGCEVWLDDLADRIGRNQEICVLHAERLTVPRGWTLSDRRSAQPSMFVTEAVAPSAAEPPKESAPRTARRRRASSGAHPATQTLELFEVLRQELAEAELAEVEAPEVEGPEAAPEPEPEPESERGAEADPAAETDHDELPESLRATSPLLSRAFAATGHQRSVLTQPGPDPTED